MTVDSPADDTPNEIEISLDDAELRLQKVEIDAETPPLEFAVDGVIRSVDPDVMDRIKGATIEPTAVRFRLATDTD